MRVFLTSAELATDTGKQLLSLATRIALDGKLDLEEIEELRSWLRVNRPQTDVAAVTYLNDIMTRVAADGHIDRDELIELHLAVERVIPSALRLPITQARKTREKARRLRAEEARRLERERTAEDRRRAAEIEHVRSLRMRHCFARVAGVTYPNDDGTERQTILRRCSPGEQLILRHDPHNRFSPFATEVLRLSGEQLGHVPEYLAERVCSETNDGHRAIGVLTTITGGTWDKPTRGANIAIFFISRDVTNEELQQYAEGVLSSES